MIVTLVAYFVDFLKSVDLPKVRTEEYCKVAGSAFHKNDVMHFFCVLCMYCGMFLSCHRCLNGMI
jgi:hypothetical protein